MLLLWTLATRAAGAPFAPLTHEPLHNTVVPAPVQPKPEPKTAQKDREGDASESGLFESLGFGEGELGQLLGALEGFKDKEGQLSKDRVFDSAERRETFAPKQDKVEAQPNEATAWRRQSRAFLGKPSEIAGELPLVPNEKGQVTADDPNLSNLLVRGLHQSRTSLAQRRVLPSSQRLSMT